jgi:hypothetical protein
MMLPSFVCVSHIVAVAMNEFESFQNDTLLNAMELYKLKHPKHMNFTFIIVGWCSRTCPSGRICVTT